MSLPNHRQVHITHGELQADVDSGLAHLLLALWQLGMRTEFSCQNFGVRRRRDEPSNPHYGYIAFTHYEDAVQFVRHSRSVFQDGDTGLLALETAGERAFVDFPAYKLTMLTSLWCIRARHVSRETSVQDRHA